VEILSSHNSGYACLRKIPAIPEILGNSQKSQEFEKIPRNPKKVSWASLVHLGMGKGEGLSHKGCVPTVFTASLVP